MPADAHLLTVYEDVDALSQSLVYPANCSLKMRFEICGCAFENVKTIRLKLDALSGMRIRGGNPGSIEDLDKGADGVCFEEVWI